MNVSYKNKKKITIDISKSPQYVLKEPFKLQFCIEWSTTISLIYDFWCQFIMVETNCKLDTAADSQEQELDSL